MNGNKHRVFCTFHDAPAHRFSGHPESPQRLEAMRDWLENPPYPEIEWLDEAQASEADVMLVQEPQVLAFLMEESARGAHQFESAPSYVTQESVEAALGAVGATLAVSRRIMAEGSGRGFAIVRPPGHHAEPDRSMGFCLLNNTAIAAADAVASGMERVAIIDIDAHHGNGIESAFWQTPQVGYLSIHEEGIYPGSGQIGSAPHATGRIINIPLPSFSGNLAYQQILDQIIAPWVKSFKPEMIFVDAGFDAHFSDPLTTLTLNTDAYYTLTSEIVALAEKVSGGRIMFVLEGGYDPVALKDNIQACLAAMCGHEDYPDHYGKGPGPQRDVSKRIEDIRIRHHI